MYTPQIGADKDQSTLTAESIARYISNLPGTISRRDSCAR